MTARARVEAVIREEFKFSADFRIEPYTAINGGPDSLSLDSIEAVELVMALEEEFETDIEDEVAECWRTVGDIYRWAEGLSR